ncbi:ABC transporter permease [Desulfitobacterium sp.]|uniref:ABC transporter permease n=1 Tax=Desulfitobacterium sp. TaxID=49981 RepID=UPI002CAEB1EC|nr:ABC transporter permease [Desulfitobacterium sp.]HVJ49434.1 ABC transporter permease [Desulfitobacterium sp.]
MITVSRFFFRRIASEWKYQYEAWKTAVDWIVALYIVIPFSLLFLDAYLSWWKNVPGWLDYIPLNALLGVILLFVWSGTIRIFVEDADQLFLFQQKRWREKLIKYSLAYSFGFNMFMTSLLFLILAPFLLLHYGFSSAELVGFIIFVFGLKTSMGIVIQLVERRFQGWRQNLVKLALFTASGVYLRQSVAFLTGWQDLFFLSMTVLFMALILLSSIRVTLQGVFHDDVRRGQAARLKLVNFLLRQAGTLAKSPRNLRQRPWLFRNSNRLFKKRTPENVLVELCLKSTLRKGENVSFYLQVVGACLLMLSAFPPDWKWFLWMTFIILLTAVVRLYWLEVVNSPFVNLFPWLPETKINAASHALFLMALPSQLIIGLVVAIQTQAWLIALVMLPVGLFIGYFTARKLVSFNLNGGLQRKY